MEERAPTARDHPTEPALSRHRVGCARLRSDYREGEISDLAYTQRIASRNSNRPGQGRVRFGSAARQSLRDGFATLADAVEPTLGPHGRLVAVQRDSSSRTKAPDLLNDGAAIARRIYELPRRWETMGLLLARHMATQVEEAVSDGGVTALVIARAILEHGLRHVAAGHDPLPLRRGLEKSLVAALSALERSARPLDVADEAVVVALARTITGNEALARLVHECFEVVGPNGAIEVRPSQSVAHDREYIQGVLWNEGWKSSHFTTHGGTAVLERPYLLFTTHRLTTAAQLAPIMSKMIEANAAGSATIDAPRSLVVIAFAIEGDALNILVANKVRGVLPSLAIHAPGAGNERYEILRDLSVLCGGRLFAEEAGDRLEAVDLAALGRADEVQAVRSAFTVIGGKGRPAAIRQRIVEIRKSIPFAKDAIERDRLSERVGKLLGGVALLRVGGATEAERAYLRGRVEQAVRTIRLAIAHGVVAGGGAAFLACLPALEALRLEDDEAPAPAILSAALRAPMAAIVRNAGHDPGFVVQEAITRGDGYGFDVRCGRLVDMRAAHVVDPLGVVTAALRAAVSCAGMALTTEALVHKPRSVRDDDVKLDP